MNERDKKALLWGGIAVAVILLLYMLIKPANGNVTIEQPGSVGDVNISIPGLHIPARGGFSIPPLGESPYIMEGRSACGCDGKNTSGPVSYKPAKSGPTIVFNQASAGPTIYNYYQPSAQPNKGKSSLVFG